ncbi:MAG: response regulator [Acidobacteria bacterium]|nr:response regulator [Acidobacteriota bacterium]
MTANSNVLLVDDDSNVLHSLKRQLRDKFTVKTAEGPEQAMEEVRSVGPFAVIVSDLRMPGMSGIQFLALAAKECPDSTRIILTGNADLNIAIRAFNEGNIFRFLTKPCHPEELIRTISQGMEKYRLTTAEKELLGKTLKGSINMLMELLSVISPEVFGLSNRIKRLSVHIASQMGIADYWQIETAAMLSQIGYATLPENTVRKMQSGQDLSGEEERIVFSHPKVAAGLLAHIPRLEEVSRIVACQLKNYDGTGFPKEGAGGDAIPLGARILKVVLDFHTLEDRGCRKAEALDEMKKIPGKYDPSVLKALKDVLDIENEYTARDVSVAELMPGMVLSEDLRTAQGLLLIARGNEISKVLIEKLKNFSGRAVINEPFRVFVPKNPAALKGLGE